LVPQRKPQVGNLARISDIFPPRQRGYDWESILRRIPKGYARSAFVHHSTAREAITKLEKLHKIPRGEFAVRSKLEGRKRRVYLLHLDLGATPIEKAKTTERPAFQLKEEDVEKFILGKPDNMTHTIAEIQRRFVGRVLSSRTDASDYHRTKRIIRKAQEKIEQQLGGKFIGELQSDGTKVYRFQKNA